MIRMNTVHKLRSALPLAVLLALLLSSSLLAGNGLIYTIAGAGQNGSPASGILATSAQLTSPYGICVDASNNIYIADQGNNRVVKVDAVTGILTLVAGKGMAYSSGDGGPAVLAGINGPTSVALDAAGNLYISESNRIRRVDKRSGVIATIAGTGTQGFRGDGGPATNAYLNRPLGIALDSTGNLYFVDVNNLRIRRINLTTGIITTVAGNGADGFTPDGSPAAGAALAQPFWAAFDPSGGLLVSELGSRKIRRVDLRQKSQS